MKFAQANRFLCVVLIGTTLAGCHETNAPLDYLGDAHLDYYLDRSTTLAYPDVDSATEGQHAFGEGPRSLKNPRKDEVRDFTLAEAIHTALANNKLIRSAGSFGSPFNALLNNPEGLASSFDPAIQESGFLFGQRGVEAALSEFDANFTTTMTWGRNEQIQNTPLFGISAGQTRVDETSQFTSQLEKVTGTGGRFLLQHNWDYSLNNLPAQLFPSSYNGLTSFEFRQPLLAGFGAEYTRIAGPIGRNLRGVSGFNQGVVIARINNDITIADFEANVNNLVKDVEEVYWDLYLAYRAYDSEVVARDGALRTWREVKARYDQGLEKASAADESQARDNYFEAKVRSENALADVYAFETRLRRLLGMPVSDGTIIRPADEPTTAEYIPDWHLALAEGLTRRVELRRHKWTIKSLELQMQAAESVTRPRLDFVSRASVNAFGDSLWSFDDDDGITTQGYKSGYGSLLQGDETGWNLGFEMSIPIGFRQARAAVRNYELRLAKARTALGDMELEIAHELSDAFQTLERNYRTAEINFNRRKAAERRVFATQAEYEAGRTTLDLLLRAQISLAAAEVAYFQSLVQYNKAIANIHHRKGTLLELNNVHLQEGGWEPEAYELALRRAWERSHAYDSKSHHAEPLEFALPYPSSIYTMQQFGEDPAAAGDFFDGDQLEEVPAGLPVDDPMDAGGDGENHVPPPPTVTPQPDPLSQRTSSAESRIGSAGDADARQWYTPGVPNEQPSPAGPRAISPDDLDAVRKWKELEPPAEDFP